MIVKSEMPKMLPSLFTNFDIGIEQVCWQIVFCIQVFAIEYWMGWKLSLYKVLNFDPDIEM